MPAHRSDRDRALARVAVTLVALSTLLTAPAAEAEPDLQPKGPMEARDIRRWTRAIDEPE